jgi:hypothetical protein
MFLFLNKMRAVCPKAARAMGYLDEATGIEGRFRRVGAAWKEHIEHCHKIIHKGIANCSGHRTVAVLGAGLIHDVPLKELSERFQKVLLVDICHPVASRKQYSHYPNVEEYVADVTESIELLYKLPNPEQPFHCPIPHLLRDREDLDLTISINLFSQLPCMPMNFLKKWGYGRPWMEDFAHKVMQRHVDWLRLLPGIKVLITDIERQMLDQTNRIIERLDLTYGVSLPLADAEWIWKLAPIPEVSREYHYFRKVVGYSNLP